MSDFAGTMPPVKLVMYALNKEKSELNSAAVFLLQAWNAINAKNTKINPFVFIVSRVLNSYRTPGRKLKINVCDCWHNCETECYIVLKVKYFPEFFIKKIVIKNRHANVCYFRFCAKKRNIKSADSLAIIPEITVVLGCSLVPKAR